jgi:hypothetical protein
LQPQVASEPSAGPACAPNAQDRRTRPGTSKARESWRLAEQRKMLKAVDAQLLYALDPRHAETDRRRFAIARLQTIRADLLQVMDAERELAAIH